MSVLWCLAVNLRGPLRNILRCTMFVKNWGVCAFFAKILQNYVVQQIFTVGNSSCGKVMFSQVCVKNSVHSGGGGCIPACTGRGVGVVYPSMHWAGGLCGRHPPGQTPSPRRHLPPRWPCTRWYASHWNAFLLRDCSR